MIDVDCARGVSPGLQLHITLPQAASVSRADDVIAKIGSNKSEAIAAEWLQISCWNSANGGVEAPQCRPNRLPGAGKEVWVQNLTMMPCAPL